MKIHRLEREPWIEAPQIFAAETDAARGRRSA
jgi:hypothetical protein